MADCAKDPTSRRTVHGFSCRSGLAQRSLAAVPIFKRDPKSSNDCRAIGSFSAFRCASRSGRCSLLLLLVHLRVVAAIVTVGRHHHRALSSEGLGHRLALPAAAPTHRTLLDASQQGAQPLPDRSWRAPCGRWASSASFASIPDALKQACRSSSLEASRSPRPWLSRCCRRCSRRALQAAAPACEVTTGGCEDVVSRASICSDSTDLYSTHGRRRPAHGRTPFEIWALFRRNPLLAASPFYERTHTTLNEPLTSQYSYAMPQLRPR